MPRKIKFTIKKELKKFIDEMYGWNVQDLADALDMSKQQISPILLGRIEPSMNFLHKLCQITGLKLENIIKTRFTNEKD